MSKTLLCPKCKGFAVIVERTEDFRYVVKCKNCGKFEITGLEERQARRKYTERMKETGKKLA